MSKITTFLTYDDRAEEAVKLYVSLFPNSRIKTTTHYGEAGGPMPKGTVMTIKFELDGQEYVALNGGPSFSFTHGVSLMVTCDTQEEIDRYWKKLTEGGGKEIQCGWLVDRFGLSWQIVPRVFMELMTSSDKARVQRMMAAMMQMVKMDIAALKRAYEGG
jgi:predicted 3-demethylubiquinone-9 3-methyltransferase (glyoxalase superfamily)